MVKAYEESIKSDKYGHITQKTLKNAIVPHSALRVLINLKLKFGCKLKHFSKNFYCTLIREIHSSLISSNYWKINSIFIEKHRSHSLWPNNQYIRLNWFYVYNVITSSTILKIIFAHQKFLTSKCSFNKNFHTE